METMGSGVNVGDRIGVNARTGVGTEVGIGEKVGKGVGDVVGENSVGEGGGEGVVECLKAF